MLKRSHFFPLLLATSPIVVTTVAVDTAHNLPEEVHHLRHPTQPLVPRQASSAGGQNDNNNDNDDMRTNQQQPRSIIQRRLLGKSSKSKTRKAKHSKQSRDGSLSYNIDYYDDNDYSAMNGDIPDQYELNGGEEDDEEEGVSTSPFQMGITFDIYFATNNNNEDTSSSSSSTGMPEHGDLTTGEGSDAQAHEFSLFYDRNDGAGGGSSETGSDATTPTASTTSTDLISGGGESSTTTTTTTTLNITNNEGLTKWQLQTPSRRMAVAAAGVITLVSIGSVLFVSVGLFIHAKRGKSGVVAAAANNNSVEDASEDASSIWSANEEGEDYAGDIAGGGGGSMPMSSPQSPGVSSIAAMGMASPLALQLSGRNVT